MFVQFPDTGRIEVPRALSAQLAKAVENLPHYDNREFYSVELQTSVRNKVRKACSTGFDWIIKEITDRISKWPYSVLVQGLSFDEGNRLFVALNRAFGQLVAGPYEKPRAQLVHYIQPSTDIPSSRGGSESERLHTDTADWDRPVELISMVCVRPDLNGGGRSRILDVDTIRDEVRESLGREVLQLLESEPVPWKLAPYLGGGLKWRTVLSDQRVCWRRYTIDLGLESSNSKLSDRLTRALNAFEDVVSSSARTVDLLMEKGDLLFLDNRRTIHARTPLANGRSDRLMIRSWMRAS